MSFNNTRGARWLSCALLGVAAACARPSTVDFAGVAAKDAESRAITVQRPALYPETIEYDAATDRLLLGSFREGAIYQVDRAGKAARLVDDPRLCSVLGVALDAAHGQLWAVSSNLGASLKSCAAAPKKLAGVGIYDLETGKPRRYLDLAPLVDGPHLLNGIAVDAAGAAYVTDSFSPVIYRVEASGSASVFARDARFAGDGINLNGVVVHPRGYLLVVKKSDGSLFKVPLDAPSRLSQVVSATKLVGGDGLTLIGEKGLVVIANRTPQKTANAAYFISSDDDWASAQLRAERSLGDVYPTTAVRLEDTLYVVHSKLNELIDAPPEKKGELQLLPTITPFGRVAP
ncbi:MAG TPA: hypothetical protein VEQ59_13190 [Polyangiaceae bacterium]|nr:hypothetical protein [Polyangiaceae bacterium]